MAKLSKSLSNSVVIKVTKASQVPAEAIYNYRILNGHSISEEGITDEEIAKEFIGKYIRIYK